MTGPWLWRSMRAGDLGQVVALADVLFPDHLEDAARFAERRACGGDLCLALGRGGDVGGYAVAYPWPLGAVPALNRPPDAPRAPNAAVYLHDLGVRRDLTGAGHAGAGLALLVRRARSAGHGAIALVAVNASTRFWRAHGFAQHALTPTMHGKLASYGADARYMTLTL